MRRFPSMPRFRHVCIPDDLVDCDCRARWEDEGDRRYHEWVERDDREREDPMGMTATACPRRLRCPECDRPFRNPGHLGLHRLRAHGVAGARRRQNRGRSKAEPEAPTLAERRARSAAGAYRAEWDALTLRVRPAIRPDVRARFAAILARVDERIGRESVSGPGDVEMAEEVTA